MQRKRGQIASQVCKADVNAMKYNVISRCVSCVTDCKKQFVQDLERERNLCRLEISCWLEEVSASTMIKRLGLKLPRSEE